MPIGAHPVAGGVLHPGVGGDDEEAGQPGAEKHQEGGEPVSLGAEALFAEEENAEETGFQEEGEDAFHGEGLPDDSAGGFGEARPVGAELEFHGDAGDYTHGEIDGEDPGPETRRAMIVIAARSRSEEHTS